MGKLQDMLSGLKQITGKAASSAVKATTEKLATEKKDDSLWGKLKSFAKSDTGKALGMAAGTIAAGRYGGAQGISAFSSALERSRQEEERRKLEEENRDLRKIQKAKAEIDIERSKEDLAATKNKNYADLQSKIVGGMMGLPGAIGKATGVTAEKNLPKPPAPTPVSIEDEEAVARGEVDAAEWAAKVVAAMRLNNAGKQEWEANKFALDKELRTTGLTKEQQAAAWKEMSRLIMPGQYEIAGEMAQYKTPEYTGDEKNAKIQENLLKSLTSIPGPMGTLLGLPDEYQFDVLGTGGREALQRAANKPVDWLRSRFTGQSTSTSTPAVAGADKTAADDMASYGEDNERAMQIASGLARVGVTSMDTPSIMAQLVKLPEFAINKERRDKMLNLVKSYLFQQQQQKQLEPTMAWQNQNAWRSL